VGSVEVVEVLPLLQLVVEKLSIVDDHSLEHPVELFFVDAVGSFHLPVKSWGGRFDVDVSDTAIEDVVVELGLELGTVVGSNHLDTERELRQEIVGELDSGLHVASRIDLQHSQPGAVIDRSELIEPFSCPTNGCDELDVDLDGVAGLRLLVAFPPFLIRLVFLRGREPVQIETVQDPPHPRLRNHDVVVPLEIHRYLARPEVVVLTKVDDLADHLSVGGV